MTSHSGVSLFVDDVRHAPSKDWQVARSNTEAIRILATVPVAVISVDHDIIMTRKTKDGHTVPVVDRDDRLVDCSETFEPVIRYLALMPAEIRPEIIKCHSLDPSAYDKYNAILSPVGVRVSK